MAVHQWQKKGKNINVLRENLHSLVKKTWLNITFSPEFAATPLGARNSQFRSAEEEESLNAAYSRRKLLEFRFRFRE